MKMALNQYEALMSQAADKLTEWQDHVRRIMRAAEEKNDKNALAEIREILRHTP
jgi:hypothetical protein